MASIAGLLTVDCGNSTVDCFHHDDGARLRFDSHLGSADVISDWLAERRVSRCVVASVVAAVGERVIAVLRRSDLRVERVGVDLPCPLRLAYSAPDKLGVDRWLAAFAAHRRYGKALVADCGSATTINLVDASGAFLGGCIGPGLRALVVGMSATTPALPAPCLEAMPTLPAVDTQQAIDAGVLLGYGGLVERLVSDSLRVFGPARVVLTGGNSTIVRRTSRLQADIENDLVHRGMHLLALDVACVR